MTFGTSGAVDTKESVEAAKLKARRLVRLWDRRFLYVGSAFGLSCASVYPFLYGHALNSRWESVGKYLVMLSMFLLIPFCICTGVAINTRMYLRNLNKIEL